MIKVNSELIRLTKITKPILGGLFFEEVEIWEQKRPPEGWPQNLPALAKGPPVYRVNEELWNRFIISYEDYCKHKLSVNDVLIGELKKRREKNPDLNKLSKARQTIAVIKAVSARTERLDKSFNKRYGKPMEALIKVHTLPDKSSVPLFDMRYFRTKEALTKYFRKFAELVYMMHSRLGKEKTGPKTPWVLSDPEMTVISRNLNLPTPRLVEKLELKAGENMNKLVYREQMRQLAKKRWKKLEAALQEMVVLEKPA